MSAVAGELFSRFMSSMIRRYTADSPKTAGEKLEQLNMALLRAHAVAEEAAARRVTNGAMLLQLSFLMDAMYRGHYVLDTFRYHRLPQPLSASAAGRKRRLSSAKASGAAAAMDELGEVVSRLEAAIGDMDEFLVFLGSYSPARVFSQPYSTYLFLDNFMFGRQIELQRITGFLLQRNHEGDHHRLPDLEVLQVIGRRGSGKRTLVEHACADERVRARFSVIIRICKQDQAESFSNTPPMAAVRDYQKLQKDNGSSSYQRTLFIVEFDGEAAWGNLYGFLCSSASRVAHGSKIILTSATEPEPEKTKTMAAAAAAGQVIRLDYLSAEEYWYFFKSRAFGAIDPEDRPELAGIAMAVAAELRRSFMYANMYGGLMRADMDAGFWRALLRGLRGHVRSHVSVRGGGMSPMDLIGRSRPSYVHPIGNGGSNGKGSKGGRGGEVYLLYDYRSTAAERVAAVPGVSVQDLIVGRGVPDGDEGFEVLGWRSNIPPYYCYLASCEKRRTAAAPAPLKKTTTRAGRQG